MFVDRGLAARLETGEAELTRRYVEAYATLYPNVGAGSIEVCGGRVSFAGKDSPLSRADAVALTGAVTDGDFDLIEEFLTAREARPAFVACPFTHKSLFSLAGERGYEVTQFLNLFVLPLGGAETGGLRSESGLEVFRIEDRGVSKDEWALIAGLGFAGMHTGDPPYMDIYRSISNARGTTSYLATVSGNPAGAGALKVAGNTAFLSTASTLPRFRRQGVQTALLKVRLADAKRQGCDLAVVMTSPGADSERNVVRAGFRLAYTRLRLVKK